MLHVNVQYILCLFYFDMAFEHESRSILFPFGLIIPSLTEPAYLYFILSYMDVMDLRLYEPGGPLITTLYYDRVDQSQHKWHMFWASFLMAAACPLLCIAAAQTLWTRYSRKE
jgi:ABC-type spermidine/putrescine transport system permease subunit I